MFGYTCSELQQLASSPKSCFPIRGGPSLKIVYVIEIRKLIIWIAESFLDASSSRNIEEVEEDYLEDLISRSLVLVGKRSAVGKTKSCKLHDLLPELCPRDAQKGSQFKSAKHKVHGLDKDNFIYNKTVTECDALKDVIEKVTHVVKIKAFGDGRSICKTSCAYHTKDDVRLTEKQTEGGKEKIKAGKAKALVMFKAVEAYLLANPRDEYN